MNGSCRWKWWGARARRLGGLEVAAEVPCLPSPAAGLTCHPCANVCERRVVFFREDDERFVHRVVHIHQNLFFGSKAPIGYNRIKVSDEGEERPSLEIDASIAPVEKEIFE